VVLNTGEVVFEADIDVGDSSEDCVGGGRAIVERGASGFRSIVSEGDPVPSVENWFFEEPRLLDVLENGDALVFAELLRPAPVFSERLDLASWWVFPRNGAPRLVHLEGEQVTRSDGELVTEFGGISNGEITGLFQPTVQVSTSGHALLRLEELLAANSRNTFHVGRIPDGQPHGSLEAPGASSLLPVAETYLDAELPGSSLESIAGPDTRLGTVDDPVMGSDGQVYFVASIIDTNPLSSVGRWVLRINSDGEIESHVGPTDRVDVAGIDQLALSGVLGASRGINIFPFDDGSLLLSARLAGNFLDALVFVESNRN